MEERLDDAIDILKEHAEGQLYPGNPLAQNHVVRACHGPGPVLTQQCTQPNAAAATDGKGACQAPGHLLPSQKEAGKKGKKAAAAAEKAAAPGKGAAKRRGRCVGHGLRTRLSDCD